MKLTERQQAILEWVGQKEHLEIEEIADHFAVTAQTIRKDINQLCESGLLRRRYGGVSLPSSVVNLSVESRQILNQFAKQSIATRLASMIPENSSVYLGIGTTMEFVARELSQHKGLKVFTNNLNAASLLCNSPEVDVRVSGGQLRHSDHDLVGQETVEFYNRFHADFGIIGIGSMDAHGGLMDFDVHEAHVGQAIINNCRRRVLVADQSKWDRNALAKVARFEDIDLFVTDSIPEQKRSALPTGLQVIETEVG